MKDANIPLAIDFHVHALDRKVFEICAPHSVNTGFGARPPMTGEPVERLTNPEVQIAHMDEVGVDVAVLSTGTVIATTSWAEPKKELELIQRLNDNIAEWIARYPKRFLGSFTLPLRDLDLSAREMERCVNELGFKVANMVTSVEGKYFGDSYFTPFWQQVDELGTVVWFHPEGVKDPWFQRYALWNSAGQSMEEVKVMSSLIYEGIPEKFPNVKIVIAHGGGYFPHYMGRFDRNIQFFPFTMENITKKPGDYLNFFYYDTCVYDPRVIRNLIEIVGVDRLVMGSDFPVGENDPIEFLADRCHLNGADLRRVACDTPAALLGLKAEVAAA